MSPLSFLHELYRRDVAYFQRMLDFFLRSRFHTVHLWVDGHRREPVFLSTEGAVVHCVHHNRRWKTLTDWYNHVTGGTSAPGDPAVFEHIQITRRVSIQNILKTIAHKEVEEFVDMKYRSSQIYHWILRRLKARHTTCGDTKAFQIQWEGRVYILEKHKTVTEGGYSVGPFLEYMSGEKHPTGVSWKDTTGWVRLTEDLLPLSNSSSEVFSEPSEITEDSVQSSVESDVQELKDNFRIQVEAEKQARDKIVEEFMDELAFVRSELSELRSEMRVYQAEKDALRGDLQTLQVAFDQQQAILISLQGLQALVFQNYQTLQTVQTDIQRIQMPIPAPMPIQVPVQMPVQMPAQPLPYPRFAYRT